MEVYASRSINAPIDRVFDVFSDISKIGERIEGISQVDILSDVQQGLGTRWRETRVVFGREATEEMEISSFKPNQSYEVLAASNGSEYHSIYTFTDQGNTTLVEMVHRTNAVSLIAKLMIPVALIFKGTMKKLFEADLDELKAVCEQT